MPRYAYNLKYLAFEFRHGCHCNFFKLNDECLYAKCGGKVLARAAVGFFLTYFIHNCLTHGSATQFNIVKTSTTFILYIYLCTHFFYANLFTSIQDSSVTQFMYTPY